MSLTNVRYKCFPQMKDYDKAPSGVFSPYSMLSGPPSFNSIRINTDELGFRNSYMHNQVVKVTNKDEYSSIGFLVGGSTAFGVGADNDKGTISSLLASVENEPWVNLGVRGSNSLQEYIHLINNLHQASHVRSICLVSGINDLYLSLVNDVQDYFDPGFGTKYSALAVHHPYRQAYATFVASLFNNEPGEFVHKSWIEMVTAQLFKNRNKVEPAKLSLDERIALFLSRYRRNFKLYRGLSRTFNCKFSFVFQPVIFWTEKIVTNEENDVLTYLIDSQRDSHWDDIRKILIQPGMHEEICNYFVKLSEEFEIPFIDANPYFKDNAQSCFVDSVHLTNAGNMIIRDLIKGL